MAVVIDEFQVQLQQPQGKEGGGGEAPAPAPAQGISPMDLRDVLRHQAERAARLRAHRRPR